VVERDERKTSFSTALLRTRRRTQARGAAGTPAQSGLSLSVFVWGSTAIFAARIGMVANRTREMRLSGKTRGAYGNVG
jgi:hypothetical protein